MATKKAQPGYFEFDVAQIFTPVLVRALGDKLYDKRKVAAHELEDAVRNFANAEEDDVREKSRSTASLSLTLMLTMTQQKIIAILKYLQVHFVQSSNAHVRKGGLIGLAACGIGLGPKIPDHLEEILLQIIRLLVDQDSRVRYYATESLYNVSKVAKVATLIYFNEVFDALSTLSCDVDENVRQGALHVDNLLKDIVMETRSFRLNSFIPLLKERLGTTTPEVRVFLIEWISTLHTSPDINMMDFLPDLLPGLLHMLGDPSKKVQLGAEKILTSFEGLLRSGAKVDLIAMTQLLPIEASSEEVDGKHPLAVLPLATHRRRQSALHWIFVLVECAGQSLLSHYTPLVSAALMGLSAEEEAIAAEAVRANAALLRVFQTATVSMVPLTDLVNVLSSMLRVHGQQTRLSALRWLSMLSHAWKYEIHAQIEEVLFPELSRLITDPVAQVVTADLELLAFHSEDKDSKFFHRLIGELVGLFRADPVLLETRCPLVVRTLSTFLGPELVFVAMADRIDSLVNSEDPGDTSELSAPHSAGGIVQETTPSKQPVLLFAALAIQTLHLILLTSMEAGPLRKVLRKSHLSAERQSLFISLYRPWSHSPVSLIGYLFLCGAYRQAQDVIGSLASVEVSVEYLVQVDKLVQLLESPIYAEMRQELVNPLEFHDLSLALYALLLLLPQSRAFEALRHRLHSIGSVPTLLYLRQQQTSSPTLSEKNRHGSKNDETGDAAAVMVPWEELRTFYLQTLAKHEEVRQLLYRQDLEGQNLVSPAPPTTAASKSNDQSKIEA